MSLRRSSYHNLDEFVVEHVTQFRGKDGSSWNYTLRSWLLQINVGYYRICM